MYTLYRVCCTCVHGAYYIIIRSDSNNNHYKTFLRSNIIFIPHTKINCQFFFPTLSSVLYLPTYLPCSMLYYAAAAGRTGRFMYFMILFYVQRHNVNALNRVLSRALPTQATSAFIILLKCQRALIYVQQHTRRYTCRR